MQLIGLITLNVSMKEYPPYRETYRRTFLAIVGALTESCGAGSQQMARVRRFIIDILACQLYTQDLNELWEIDNPMAVLMNILKNEGRAAPESRLLWLSGKDTILACYHVGIYSNKELIGQGNVQFKSRIHFS